MPRLIALTSHGRDADGRDADRARAKAAGFDEHLTKAADVGRLLGAVDATRPPQTAGVGA